MSALLGLGEGMVIARLVLYGALAWANDHGSPSEWPVEKWERLFARLTPREAVALALHAIRGMTFTEIGDWLGVSRGRADQLYRRARDTLATAVVHEL